MDKGMQSLHENHSNILSIIETFKQSSRSVNNLMKALDNSTIVAITDRYGVITYVNDKFCELSKYSREELIGKTHRILNSKYHTKDYFKEMWNTILNKEIWHGEIRNQAKDGSYYWTDATIVPFLNENKEIEQFVAIRHDITDRVKAQKALKISMENDFKKIVQNLQNGLFTFKQTTPGHFIFTLFEGQLSKTLNLTTEQVYNKTVFDVFEPKIANEFYDAIVKCFRGELVSFEVTIKSLHLLVNVSPMYRDGEVQEITGSIVDITLQKLQQQKLYKMEHFDSLTMLPNRMTFEHQLEQDLQIAKIKNEKIAILFVNFLHFKNINATLGHQVGDLILCEVAKRLTHFIGNEGIVARFGADDFIISVQTTGLTEKLVRDKTKKLIQILSKSYIVQGSELFLKPNIGVSLYPNNSENVLDLIKHSAAANNRAKKEKNSFYFFDNALQDLLHREMIIETDLRKAIEHNELSLVYQPKYSVKDNKIKSVEALLRWHHPKLGFISPMEFIPIAEELGLIIPIGKWVIQQGIEQLKQWDRQGLNKLSVAINLSIKQFTQATFIDEIEALIKSAELQPQRIELEITESIAMDIDLILPLLEKLKLFGCQISIDDFGTGYSSMQYLQQMPIDKLKIDQSFVRDLNSKNQSIIIATIQLAKNLGLSIVAEGVELNSHVNFLTAQGCDELQGYYFSPPIKPEDLNDMLK